MTKIEVLHTFKSKGQTFYAGEVRFVSESDAGLFCGMGWATSQGVEGGEASPTDVTLEVQNGSIGHAATDVGAK